MPFQDHHIPPSVPDEESTELTGPRRFWELIQSELAALLIVNMLFLLCCIPVVTIPPALLALHRSVYAIVHDRPREKFFSCFRQGWKQAYGAFFITALPLGLAGYGGVFYLNGTSQYLFLLLPFALCAFTFWVAALSSTYLYALLCGGMPLRAAVRRALILGIAKPLRAVLATLCFYGLPLAGVLFIPLSTAYLLLVGFSFPLLLGHFYLRIVVGHEKEQFFS